MKSHGWGGQGGRQGPGKARRAGGQAGAVSSRRRSGFSKEIAPVPPCLRLLAPLRAAVGGERQGARFHRMLP